jgi:virginiamycin B lyase
VKRAPARHLLGPALVLLGLLLLPSTAAAQTRFAVPGGGSPAGITVGPDGALWFTQADSDQIGRITTAGEFQEFSIPAGTSPAAPDDIVAGPDGRLWFTEPGRSKIGAVTTAGAFNEYPTSGTLTAPPDGLTVGPDGNIWFTEFEPPPPDGTGPISRIGSIRTDGTGLNQYSLANDAAPSDITAGSDGRLWFTESGSGQVGTITTSGAPGEKYPAGAEPGALTAGPGSSIWFTVTGTNQIGRIAGGVVTHFGPTAAGPAGLTIGPDDALWFSQFDDPASGGSGASAIGRVSFTGAITNIVLPVNSHPDGITAGPAGRREIWFTEFGSNNIARIDLPPPFVPPPPPPPVAVAPPPKKKASVGCVVPKLRGLGVKKAKKKLRRAKCKFRIEGKGRVASTRPGAGKRTRRTVVVKAKRGKRKARSKATAAAGAIRWPGVQ